MLLDNGVRAPHKVLEAYMGDVVWPAEPLGAYLTIMFWVVIVLFGQHEDQLKYGSPHLAIGYI